MARADRVLGGLRDLLVYVAAKVPYYRDRFDVYDPSRIHSRKAFAGLPILTREALARAYPLEIVADGIDLATGVREGWVELVQSSGSSGERVTVAADPALAGTPDSRRALWDLSDDPRLDRVLVFTSPGCLGRACDLSHQGRLRFDGTQLILPSTDEPFHMERDVVQRIADEARVHDALMWFVNPAYLAALIRAAKSFDIALPKAGLVLSSYQLPTRRQRAIVEEALGARMYSYYGASELGRCTVAVECKHGRLHVWEEQSYVEVVDDAGEAVRPRARGRLIITGVAGRVTPVLRYALGDVGALHAEACTCPMNGSPILELCGRARDVLTGTRGPVTSSDVDAATAHVAGLDFLQVVQPAGAAAGTALEARAIASLDAPLDVAALEHALRALGFTAVRVREVDALDPEPSGKIPLTSRR